MKVGFNGLFQVSSIIIIACLAIAVLVPGLKDNAALYLCLWAASCGAYLFSAFIVKKDRSPDRFLLQVVGFAVLMRAVVWFAQPEFTTDFYRYIWDAKVSASGVNPYKYAPSDEALSELRSPSAYNKINYKRSPTSYGPAAQAAFRAIYAISGENPIGLRVFFFAIDLICIILIAALLGKLGLPRAWLIFYAYCPLVLIELCVNMHLDVMIVALLTAAALLLVHGRALWGIVAVAVGALIKYFPALLLPLFLSSTWTGAASGTSAWKKLCVAAGGAALFFSIIALGYLPFIERGVDLAAGIRFFSSELTTTSWSPYYLISLVTGEQIAKIVAVAGLAVLGLAGFKKGNAWNRLDLFFIIIAAVALLSPVQRPWYFTWALPFCCVRVRWSWIALCCLSLLTYSLNVSYDYIHTAKLIIYAGFYVAVVAELYYARAHFSNRKAVDIA